MAEYKNIPVDPETHKKLIALARAMGFGERGQGAIVRRLVNEEYAKQAALNLLPKDEQLAPLPAVDEVA